VRGGLQSWIMTEIVEAVADHETGAAEAPYP
jgi:hypothetical protein